MIDFKVNDERMWPELVKQLDPLREAGFLTHYNGTAVVQRPLTIVVSGDAPFHWVLGAGAKATRHRDIFYDAPLTALALEREAPYNLYNSYYASVDFRKAIGPIVGNRFSQNQLLQIRRQVRRAHEEGLKVRDWGTPDWPRGRRNHVWHVLVREGVDVLNVNDLRDATRQDWRKHRSWLI